MEKQLSSTGWYLVNAGFWIGCLSVMGCHTSSHEKPRELPPRGYLNTLPVPPAKSQIDQQKIQATVSEVLAAHGFPLPETVQTLEGPVWISPRPGAAAEVVLVKVSLKPEATVTITGFARLGTNWTALGNAPMELLRQEAREIEKSIRAKADR